MTGLLLVDKPSGPTSHDIVASLRRSSGERAIGHTGTLDPLATGLLPLLFGRATRLASWLIGSDKTYEATIRLGFGTETDDGSGAPMGDRPADLPPDDRIREALEAFRGSITQVPPSHSAKRVAGRRAYEIARRAGLVDLQPAAVLVHQLDWIGRADDLLRLRVTASSGFYVRALARDLGSRLGCGAHLAGLRRTEIGPFAVGQAMPFEEALRLGREVDARLIAPADALPHLAAVTATDAGLRRVLHGNPVGPEHLAGQVEMARGTEAVRVLGPDGRLVALARPRGGALHPVAVLG